MASKQVTSTLRINNTMCTLKALPIHMCSVEWQRAVETAGASERTCRRRLTYTRLPAGGGCTKSLQSIATVKGRRQETTRCSRQYIAPAKFTHGRPQVLLRHTLTSYASASSAHMMSFVRDDLLLDNKCRRYREWTIPFGVKRQ